MASGAVTGARGKDFFDVESHPEAVFEGVFEGSGPGRLVGQQTLNGHRKTVTLTLHHIRCVPHPMLKREDFGLSAGKDHGFGMAVRLRIQVEAVAKE